MSGSLFQGMTHERGLSRSHPRFEVAPIARLRACFRVLCTSCLKEAIESCQESDFRLVIPSAFE